MMRWWIASLLLMGPVLACGYIPPALWAKTWQYASAHGLDPYLVAAVVWTESGYCPKIRGRAGEVGLGQFMPGTWRATTGAPLAWREDPDWALWATARHLRILWESFRDWRLALAAYNAGSGAVQRGQIPLSTQKYVRKVLLTYWRMRRG